MKGTFLFVVWVAYAISSTLQRMRGYEEGQRDLQAPCCKIEDCQSDETSDASNVPIHPAYPNSASISSSSNVLHLALGADSDNGSRHLPNIWLPYSDHRPTTDRVERWEGFQLVPPDAQPS